MKNMKFSTTISLYFKRMFLKIKAMFKAIKGEPHFVAMGMASGIFVSMTPTFPFQMAAALFVAVWLKASKPAAIVGAWFSNPLNMGFIYFANFKVGNFLLGNPVNYEPNSVQGIVDFIKVGSGTFAVTMVGGVFIGFIVAIIAYYITKYVVACLAARKKNLTEI